MEDFSRLLIYKKERFSKYYRFGLNNKSLKFILFIFILFIFPNLGFSFDSSNLEDIILINQIHRNELNLIDGIEFKLNYSKIDYSFMEGSNYSIKLILTDEFEENFIEKEIKFQSNNILDEFKFNPEDFYETKLYLPIRVGLLIINKDGIDDFIIRNLSINNFNYSWFEFFPNYPDLNISQYEFNLNNSILFYNVINNESSDSDSFKIRVLNYSNDVILEEKQILFLRSFQEKKLFFNYSMYFNYSFLNKSVVPRIKIIIDPDNKIKEFNKINNALIFPELNFTQKEFIDVDYLNDLNELNKLDYLNNYSNQSEFNSSFNYKNENNKRNGGGSKKNKKLKEKVNDNSKNNNSKNGRTQNKNNSNSNYNKTNEIINEKDNYSNDYTNLKSDSNSLNNDIIIDNDELDKNNLKFNNNQNEKLNKSSNNSFNTENYKLKLFGSVSALLLSILGIFVFA